MSRMTTVGRHGIVAGFAATIIMTSACGTDTETQVEDYVPYAPGAVAPPAAPHPPSSADAAERHGAAQELMPSDPADRQPEPRGKRVPD